MAKFKLAEGAEAPIKSIEGFSFSSNNTGNQIKAKSTQRHGQSALQKEMSAILVYVARSWKAQTAATRANWRSYVADCPQPSIRHPERSLSAYCNYLKRNFYERLTQGPDFSIITDPTHVVIPPEEVSVSSDITFTSIILNLTFSRAANDLDVFVFVSPVKSKGLEWFDNSTRFSAATSNVNQYIDITSFFLTRFAQLPPAGSHLFCRVIFAGKGNGQFSFYKKTIIVNPPPRPPFKSVKFGILCNYALLTHSPSIAAPGWHVPTLTELTTCINNCGGLESAGSRVKEVSNEFWYNQNPADDNYMRMFIRGSGVKLSTGGFSDLLDLAYISCIDPDASITSTVWWIWSQYVFCALMSRSVHEGLSLRLIKDDSVDPGYYQGNDGSYYKTVKIGDQVWLQSNLAETQFSDHSPIPFATSESEWNFGEQPMSCAYNFNESNI